MSEVIPKHDNLIIEARGNAIIISQSTDTETSSIYFHRRYLRDVIEELCAIERNVRPEDAA